MMNQTKYKVDKAELIEKIKANRNSHAKIVFKAQEVYRKRAIEELDARLAAAKKGKPFNLHIMLPPPSSHLADYDRVLGLLGMSVESEVQITETEYSQYVLDDWGWSSEFTMTNSNYVAGLSTGDDN